MEDTEATLSSPFPLWNNHSNIIILQQSVNGPIFCTVYFQHWHSQYVPKFFNNLKVTFTLMKRAMKNIRNEMFLQWVVKVPVQGAVKAFIHIFHLKIFYYQMRAWDTQHKLLLLRAF